MTDTALPQSCVGCAACCKTGGTTPWGIGESGRDVNFEEEGKNGEYCPKLDMTTGTCTIYDHRPLACRDAETPRGGDRCLFHLAHDGPLIDVEEE